MHLCAFVGSWVGRCACDCICVCICYVSVHVCVPLETLEYFKEEIYTAINRSSSTSQQGQGAPAPNEGELLGDCDVGEGPHNHPGGVMSRYGSFRWDAQTVRTDFLLKKNALEYLQASSCAV